VTIDSQRFRSNNGVRLVRLVVALVGLFLASIGDAVGWEHDGFHSGMSDAQVAETMRQRSQPILQRITIGNIPGAYMLRPTDKNSRVSFSFCNGLLYQHHVERDGGFADFARFVKAEAQRRNTPPVNNVYYETISAMITSIWRTGDDEFEYLIEEDYARRIGIAEVRTDLKVKSVCR
jgi:hypothetical protein